jgi:hypothetical protein
MKIIPKSRHLRWKPNLDECRVDRRWGSVEKMFLGVAAMLLVWLELEVLEVRD